MTDALDIAQVSRVFFCSIDKILNFGVTYHVLYLQVNKNDERKVKVRTKYRFVHRLYHRDLRVCGCPYFLRFRIDQIVARQTGILQL